MVELTAVRVEGLAWRQDDGVEAALGVSELDPVTRSEHTTTLIGACWRGRIHALKSTGLLQGGYDV